MIAIDRFGNAILNLTAFPVRDAIVQIAGHALPVRRTYADVAPGEPLAVVGSMGLVEIAVREGSAAHLLGLRRGTPAKLRSSGTQRDS